MSKGRLMGDWLDRQRRLIGNDATASLERSRVAVIGVGGVGGAALEAIVRAGVGHILVIDCDIFDETNLNRQIIATRGEIGKEKAAAARARAHSINPNADVTAKNLRISAENISEVLDYKPDYVIDAIDSVSAKLSLIEECQKSGIPIISSMGTGNRTDCEGFTVGAIEDTAGCGCPLARVMRRELKKRGIVGVSVLYNKNAPLETDGERAPASISYVPPVAGYTIAGYVIRQLAKL